MMHSKLGLAALAAVLLPAVPAHATSITGSLEFPPSTVNVYDPVFGFVPAGFGNTASNTVEIDLSTAEFGYSNGDFAFADFTPTVLNISTSFPTFKAWEQSFTADTPGFFNGLLLDSSDFASLDYWVTGNTLHITSDGSGPGGNFASFSFDGGGPAIPEPATWAMMMIGFGLVGISMRRRTSSDGKPA